MATSACPVIKMMGICMFALVISFCRSRPLIPGMRTSRTRHPGTSESFERKNSGADTNVRTLKPTDRRRVSIARRTSLSSSTTYMTGCVSAISIAYTRQTELKISPMVNVGYSPDSPSMRFYDRTAYGQSHADSAGLGGEKWLKKLIQLMGGNSLPGVTNRNNYVVRSLAARNENQFLRMFLLPIHSLDSIQHQIKDYLL